MQGLSHGDSDGLTTSQCRSPWDQQGERWDQKQLSLAGTVSLLLALLSQFTLGLLAAARRPMLRKQI